MAKGRYDVCVFAPALFVSVTIEERDDGSDDIHIHPGGQGFWIARMVRHLGAKPILCAPLGGETGKIIEALTAEWGIDLAVTAIAAASPAYVHDRRGGDRTTIAASPAPVLDRHERDDVYSAVLDHALAVGVAVITGRVDDIFSPGVYRRLGSDFSSNGVRVVGDLHGDELEAYLEGGPIDVLKVSDEDLLHDGRLDDTRASSVIRAINQLEQAGACRIIVSRGREPAIARFAGVTYMARPPEIEAVDHRGAGDSMTAGLAAAMAHGLAAEDTLRLACAAGTANVARHGLGNADADLVTRLAERVELEMIDS